MIPRHLLFAAATALALTACSGSDHDSNGEPGPNANGSVPGGPDGTISGLPDASRHDASEVMVDLDAIAEQPLDGLSARQARALCLEDWRRSDFCLEQALQIREPEACRAALEACRATGNDQPFAGCDSVQLQGESCPITVAEYLACTEAWAASLSCDRAGQLLETPSECRPIVSQCDRLAGAFYRTGTPPPCPGDAGTGAPPDDSDDIYGDDGCRPVPSRLVVLGDSIAVCFGASAPERCAGNLLAAHLRETAAPHLEYESHAVGGARFAEVLGQAKQVAGGPGHVLVWMYAIGNDLLARDIDFDGWEQTLNALFAYFDDPDRFPDGATFLLNTQYSPYDQCPSPPGGGQGVPLEIEELLEDVNQRLFVDVAEARDDAVALDHHEDWLGHGSNANIAACPHCGADNTSWMSDPKHPNDIGYARIADKAIAAVDRMYGSECGP